MSDTGRLLGFVLVLAAALGAGLGVGAAVGPLDTGQKSSVVDDSGPVVRDGHGAMEPEAEQ